MKTAILAILCCAALAAQAAEPVAVEGRVLNALTGDPVGNATVFLRGSNQAVYVTSSDENGRYAFAGIEPGEYALGAERAGFPSGPARKPGKLVAIAPAQKAAGLDVKLTPGGVIAGRVLDAGGQPVFEARVSVMAPTYVNGRKQIGTRAFMETTANDLGEYRLNGLPPGRYYLRADANDLSVGLANSRYEPLGPQQQDVATYFGATTDAQRAEPIEVKAGAVASGVNVTLVRAPLVQIRGHVENAAAAGGSTAAVGLLLYAADGAGMGSSVLQSETGEFVLRGAIPPGGYTLVGRALDPAARQIGYFSRHLVKVDGSPVTIAFKPGMQVVGVVRVETAGSAPVNPGQIRVSLRPVDFAARGEGTEPNQAAGADGKFAIGTVAPDRYDVSLSGLPNNVYIKSMRAGEQDLLESALDLTREAPGPIEIVLSGKAAAVEGTVQDDKDAPTAGATVALVPQAARRRERAEWYRTAVTDRLGKFSLAGIAPGEYKLFAWEDVEDGAWTDPAFLKPIDARGAAVSLREGVAESVSLKLIGGK
jgi:hypothetical protein